MPAGLLATVVAGPCEMQRGAEPLSASDDVGLGVVEDGRDDLDRVPLHPGLGPHCEHGLERLVEGRRAVGVSGEVHGVGADVYPVRVHGFAEACGDAQEHDVPGRDVCDGDLRVQIALAVHRDIDVLPGERGPERAEVQVDDDVVDVVVVADVLGRCQLLGVPLAVPEAYRGDLASVREGLRQARGGVQSTGEKNDSLRHQSISVYQAV